MKTTFQISLHIKTPAGFETYGRFDLGEDKSKAEAIFNELKGNEHVSDKTILHMDFTEISDNIPLPVKILHCTLEEIACNVKIITREMFKNLSLEGE